MRAERISYQKVFPIAQYVNEKIGVEIELEEGDSAEMALYAAKELVEKWHKESSPLLYMDVGFNAPTTTDPEKIPVIQSKDR